MGERYMLGYTRCGIQKIKSLSWNCLNHFTSTSYGDMVDSEFKQRLLNHSTSFKYVVEWTITALANYILWSVYIYVVKCSIVAEYEHWMYRMGSVEKSELRCYTGCIMLYNLTL